MGQVIQLPLRHVDEPHTPRWPVVEIFGPVVQGEGLQLGVLTHFVRFGGCDYRCTFCDTMYAVDPTEVLKRRKMMSDEDIANTLQQLGKAKWITFSGGNPALYNLGSLLTRLMSLGYNISVETQGSIYKPWLEQVQVLTLSPKPPSAGVGDPNYDVLDKLASLPNANIKVVVGDQQDLEFAAYIAKRYTGRFMSYWPPLFVQPASAPGDTNEDLLRKYAWLVEAMSERPEMAQVMARPRVHELIKSR